MSEPIEKVAERVLALDAEATPGPLSTGRVKPSGDPMFHVFQVDIRHGDASNQGNVIAVVNGCHVTGEKAALANAALFADYRTAAPALAREVLALRKLCRALAEDLSALVPGHLESDVAALAAYRQHFPAPDVKPEGPKG